MSANHFQHPHSNHVIKKLKYFDAETSTECYINYQNY